MTKKSKFDTPWDGYWFKVRGYQKDEPVLVTPYDEELTVRDIDCIPYDQQLIRALNTRIKELEKALFEVRHAPRNVVAFGPYLRRAEYSRSRRPVA